LGDNVPPELLPPAPFQEYVCGDSDADAEEDDPFDPNARYIKPSEFLAPEDLVDDNEAYEFNWDDPHEASADEDYDEGSTTLRLRKNETTLEYHQRMTHISAFSACYSVGENSRHQWIETKLPRKDRPAYRPIYDEGRTNIAHLHENQPIQAEIYQQFIPGVDDVANLGSGLWVSPLSRQQEYIRNAHSGPHPP
jgi:hypothetical protein